MVSIIEIIGFFSPWGNDPIWRAGIAIRWGDASAANAALDAIARGDVLIDGVSEAQQKFRKKWRDSSRNHGVV